MELGPDLFPTVVKWVVIFELLVKKIGCNDMEMWGAYLRVMADSFFFFPFAFARKLQSLVKMMQVNVMLRRNTFSEIKVHICTRQDGTLQSFFASCRNAPGYMPRKLSASMSWLRLNCVRSCHAPLRVLTTEERSGVKYC